MSGGCQKISTSRTHYCTRWCALGNAVKPILVDRFAPNDQKHTITSWRPTPTVDKLLGSPQQLIVPCTVELVVVAPSSTCLQMNNRSDQTRSVLTGAFICRSFDKTSGDDEPEETTTCHDDVRFSTLKCKACAPDTRHGRDLSPRVMMARNNVNAVV